MSQRSPPPLQTPQQNPSSAVACVHLLCGSADSSEIQVGTKGNRCSHTLLQVGLGYDETETCPAALPFGQHILNMNHRYYFVDT